MKSRAEVLKECRAETAEVVRDLKRLGYRVRRSWPTAAEGCLDCDFVVEDGTTIYPLSRNAGLVLSDLTGFAVFTSDHYDREHRYNTGGKKYPDVGRRALQTTL